MDRHPIWQDSLRYIGQCAGTIVWGNRWGARRGEKFFVLTYAIIFPTTPIIHNLYNAMYMIGHYYIFV